MDAYDLLRIKGGGKWIQISLKEIAENIGASPASTRAQLVDLAEKGYISVKAQYGEDGSQLPSTYKVIGAPSSMDAKAEMVRAIYVRYVNERLDNPKELAYSFLHDRPYFNKISSFCGEFSLDPHAYVLSCFYAMPAGFCRKVFRMPYPPPATLANKSKAEDRYRTFVNQFLVDDVAKNPNADIDSSFHAWERLRLRDDIPRMILFVRNGILAPEWFFCHPKVEKEHWKMVGVNENKLDVRKLKCAQRMWAERLKKEGKL